MFKARNWLFVAVAAVLVFGVASLASAQGTATVEVAKNATLGPILTDAKGLTLYQFANDKPGTSTCTAGCLAAWPALTVPSGTTPTAGPGVTGKLGTITRSDDNTIQVTYNDMPLYHWAKDTAPGQTTGQGIGNVWHVVNPDTGPVMTVAQAAATPAAGATTAAATTAPAAATTAPTAAATTAPTAAATTAPTAAATTAPTAAATTAPTAAATTAPTAAAAAATATPTPGKLPTTGSDFPVGLVLVLAAGIAALLAGLSVRMVRRPR